MQALAESGEATAVDDEAPSSGIRQNPYVRGSGRLVRTWVLGGVLLTLVIAAIAAFAARDGSNTTFDGTYAGPVPVSPGGDSAPNHQIVIYVENGSIRQFGFMSGLKGCMALVDIPIDNAGRVQGVLSPSAQLKPIGGESCSADADEPISVVTGSVIDKELVLTMDSRDSLTAPITARTYWVRSDPPS